MPDARRRGNYRNYSLTLILAEGIEQHIPKTISRNMKSQKTIRSNWYVFTKEKSCLINLISSYNEKTSLMDVGRAVDIAFLGFRMANDTVSHRILVGKLLTYGLDGQTVRCIKNCLGPEGGDRCKVELEGRGRWH